MKRIAGIIAVMLACAASGTAQTPQQLSPAAKQLFSDLRDSKDQKITQNPLSVAEMNAIYKLSGWTRVKGSNQFVILKDCEPSEVSVALLYLNDDQKPEVQLVYGGTCLAGNTGVGFQLFGLDAQGNYRKIFEEVGILDVLKSSTNKYHDIMLGGPGFEFPVYKWNGKKYMYSYMSKQN